MLRDAATHNCLCHLLSLADALLAREGPPGDRYLRSEEVQLSILLGKLPLELRGSEPADECRQEPSNQTTHHGTDFCR